MIYWYIKKRMKALGDRINLSPTDYPDLRKTDAWGGTYLKVKGFKVYYIVMERGKEIDRIGFDRLDDALYKVFDEITFTLAATCDEAKKAPNNEYRKIVFARQLELLEKINPKYADSKRRENRMMFS